MEPNEDDLRVVETILTDLLSSMRRIDGVLFALVDFEVAKYQFALMRAAEREKAEKVNCSDGIRAVVSAAVKWRYSVHASLPESRRLAKVIDANLEEAQRLIAAGDKE